MQPAGRGAPCVRLEPTSRGSRGAGESKFEDGLKKGVSEPILGAGDSHQPPFVGVRDWDVRTQG